MRDGACICAYITKRAASEGGGDTGETIIAIYRSPPKYIAATHARMFVCNELYYIDIQILFR